MAHKEGNPHHINRDNTPPPGHISQGFHQFINEEKLRISKSIDL